MSKVVPITPATKIIMPVDDAVVALLEGLLGRARDGQIQGILLATIECDGAGSVVSAGSAYAGEGVNQNVHAAIGALAALQARFMAVKLEWP